MGFFALQRRDYAVKCLKIIKKRNYRNTVGNILPKIENLFGKLDKIEVFQNSETYFFLPAALFEALRGLSFLVETLTSLFTWEAKEQT